MELTKHHPILVPAKTAVLLVFLPSATTTGNINPRSSLTRLVEPIQQQLGESVRILKIDAITHPDVVQSFDIHQFPAFVLVRQGIELWRQEGIQTTDYDLSGMSNLLA